MGIGTLGFLKGASGTMLSSIEARDAAEMELKKQKDLAEFRAKLEQQYEMAKATDMATVRVGDKVRRIGTNNQTGKVIFDRDANEQERKALEEGEADRTYLEGSRSLDTRKKEQDIANEAAREKRAQEGHGLSLDATRAQIAASNRSGRDSAAGSTSDTTGVNGGRQLVAEYANLVTDAAKAGINRGLVEQWAARIVQNAPNGDAARAEFVKSLTSHINLAKQDEKNKDKTFSYKPGDTDIDLNWR